MHLVADLPWSPCDQLQEPFPSPKHRNIIQTHNMSKSHSFLLCYFLRLAKTPFYKLFSITIPWFVKHGQVSKQYQNVCGLTFVKPLDFYWPAHCMLRSSKCRDLQYFNRAWPRGPCPNKPPTQICDLSSSHSGGMLQIFDFKLLNEYFIRWTTFVHCTTSCQTSSTKFSIIGPFVAKPIICCVCYICLSVPSIVCESYPTYSSDEYIHAVIICIFFRSSLIYPCKYIPSFNWQTIA